MDKKVVKIVIKGWHNQCGDGCCDNYGTDLIVNGKELEADGDSVESSLRATLIELGYNVEIKGDY